MKKLRRQPVERTKRADELASELADKIAAAAKTSETAGRRAGVDPWPEIGKLRTQAADASRNADNARRTVERVRRFLERLPAGAVLHPVIVAATGDLAEVRKALDAAETERRRLGSASTPGIDLRQRVTAYVNQLAHHGKPLLRNIETGRQLEILWPQHEAATINSGLIEGQKARHSHSRSTRIQKRSTRLCGCN